MELPVERSRAGWWLFTAVVATVAGVALWSFVGTVMLTLFLYYGMRPVYRNVLEAIDSRGVAASLTLVLVVGPIAVLLGYTAVLALDELARLAQAGLPVEALLRPFFDLGAVTGPNQDALAALLREPSRLTRIDAATLQSALDAGAAVAGTFTTAVVHLVIALVLAFFTLRDGHRLRSWFHDHLASPDTAVSTYLSEVDQDLEVVYVANVLTVLAVTGLAVVLYNGFNAVGVPGLSIPVPTVLALLTGLATFIPLVVGKLVYVPLTLYLAVDATTGDPGSLAAVVAFAVAAFLVLDALPQMFVRPYLAGRTLHVGLMMSAYVLGALLFGWYGLFLGPFLLVVVVHLARVVLPDLVRGQAVTGDSTDGIGSDPE